MEPSESMEVTFLSTSSARPVFSFCGCNTVFLLTEAVIQNMVGIIYITGKDRAIYREAVNLLGSQSLSQCRVTVKFLELRIYVEAFFFHIGFEAILGGGGLGYPDDLAVQIFNGLDAGIVVYQKANGVGVVRSGRSCRFLFSHR